MTAITGGNIQWHASCNRTCNLQQYSYGNAFGRTVLVDGPALVILGHLNLLDCSFCRHQNKHGEHVVCPQLFGTALDPAIKRMLSVHCKLNSLEFLSGLRICQLVTACISVVS